ncbi:twin-arginine translocation signal domain-containing protein [Streptomyces sp. NPDC050698]
MSTAMKTWFALMVRRRFLVLVVALAAAAGGIANLEGLSIDAVPDISPRQVMVLTLSPGDHAGGSCVHPARVAALRPDV